jgi:hypothetical protein
LQEIVEAAGAADAHSLYIGGFCPWGSQTWAKR